MLVNPGPHTMVSAPASHEAGFEDKARFLDYIQKAWSPFTSAYITCESPNLAWGQSDVTALAVQDKLGGEIVRVRFETPCGKKGAHFFNLLPDAARVDMTQASYPQDTLFTPPLDAPDDELQAATTHYLKQHGEEGSLRDHLLALTNNEVSAESKKLSGILSDDPPSERYAIFQHNIASAKAGRIGRG